MRKKIPKFKSKKGLSLVELIVGVTIMAMAISSAAGAIVSGYKTTIDNAARNEAAVKSASLNEVIMRAIKNCDFEDEDEARKYFFVNPSDSSLTISPNDNTNDSVMQAGKTLFPADAGVPNSGLVYYASDDFPSAQYDVQYQLDISAVEKLVATGAADIEIKGIKIRTAVLTADGFVEVTSFVPYVNQD